MACGLISIERYAITFADYDVGNAVVRHCEISRLCRKHGVQHAAVQHGSFQWLENHDVKKVQEISAAHVHDFIFI